MNKIKRSLYQSKIENLKNQNENESKTIKELLSPAAYEKLKKAQSALPNGVSCQYRLRNFNRMKQLLSGEKRQKNGKEGKDACHVLLKKFPQKKPSKTGKKQKETLWERRQKDVINAAVKDVLEEITETVEHMVEYQEVLDSIEMKARQSQLELTVEPTFIIDPKIEKPVEPLEEQDSFEFWEPKVEILEGEENVQFPDSLEKQSGQQAFGKECNDVKELPISYLSVERPSGVEGFLVQAQTLQSPAIPIERMCRLIDIQNIPEVSAEVPCSYVPVTQHYFWV